jgi:hypothetical protein
MSDEDRPGIAGVRRIIPTAAVLLIVGWWDGHRRFEPFRPA